MPARGIAQEGPEEAGDEDAARQAAVLHGAADDGEGGGRRVMGDLAGGREAPRRNRAGTNGQATTVGTSVMLALTSGRTLQLSMS